MTYCEGHGSGCDVVGSDMYDALNTVITWSANSIALISHERQGNTGNMKLQPLTERKCVMCYSANQRVDQICINNEALFTVLISLSGAVGSVSAQRSCQELKIRDYKNGLLEEVEVLEKEECK